MKNIKKRRAPPPSCQLAATPHGNAAPCGGPLFARAGRGAATYPTAQYACEQHALWFRAINPWGPQYSEEVES